MHDVGVQVFGVSEFAVRFWSAALALVTVAATYALGRRLFRSSVDFWAAIVLATTLMFNVAARAATPDSLLICCCTLALVAYTHCVRARRWPPSSRQAVHRKTLKSMSLSHCVSGPRSPSTP